MSAEVRRSTEKSHLLVSDRFIPAFEEKTNFNQHIRRGRGRARRGERAVCNLPGTRGGNLHYVASISLMDLLSISTHLGSFKATDFGEYVNQITEGLERNSIRKAVINIDNVPWYANAEAEWMKILERFNHSGQNHQWKLLRLALYSFSCSPIEHSSFSILCFPRKRHPAIRKLIPSSANNTF